MEKGDIILVPFPFTDLTGNKIRPALVLINGKDDVTLSFISTQLKWREDADVVLEPSINNGLKKSSLVRLSKICTIDKSLVLGKIGCVNHIDLEVINSNLRTLFQLD